MKNNLKFAYHRLFNDTDRKTIIFTSDDWGSIRIKSKKDRDDLEEKRLLIADNRFDRFDTLETNQDLEELFEVLLSFKDFKGNHPIITAPTNVANPNFEAIEQNGFEQYVYETIAETISKTEGRDKVLNLYKEGIANKIFIPQSHGKEHLQTDWWMNELKNKDSFARKVFSNHFFFIPDQFLVTNVTNLQASFNANQTKDIAHYSETIQQTVKLFYELFNYYPTYFTPPAMFYNRILEDHLVRNGFKYIDVELIQKNLLDQKISLNYQGRKKRSLKAIVRNNVFETNLIPNNDGVDSCLKGIELAFKYKQPAIISNHRVSFAGGIEESNRAKGLQALRKLLNAILNKWPDAEFDTIPSL